MNKNALHTRHERTFAENRFVYPVLSRRSGGISIGVNLNPDKICNFDCIYCQVDRTSTSETRFVELDALLEELGATLDLVTSGRLFESGKFAETPVPLRRLNDIAFSGDGEPTTYRNFEQIIESCVQVKRQRGRADVKLVLITNASMFHRPHVQRGLELLDQNQGEIWAKLDAGTESYYRLVERTTIPFARVLTNLCEAARQRPIVIQSLFMRIHGEGPSPHEQREFCGRLREILEAGGALQGVQLYTVARRPAESFVTPLSDEEVDTFSDLVRRETGLTVQAYYGASSATNPK